MKKITEEIIRTIDAGEWEYGNNYHTHKSGLKIWHINGVSFCETYPEKSGLSLWDKIRIWQAFRRIGRVRALKMLNP